MTELCADARNSVAMQREMFDLAKQHCGLSIKVLHLKTGIPETTMENWRRGAVIPAWALFKLGKQGGVPDELLSLIGEPFARHVGTDEGDGGDLDTAGLDAGDVAHAVQKARHPKSPGGVAIVPQERAAILPLLRRSVASGRKAVAA